MWCHATESQHWRGGGWRIRSQGQPGQYREVPRSGTVHLKIAVRPTGTCVCVYSKTLSKIEKKEEIVSKKKKKS